MKAVRKTLNPGVIEVERRAFFNASLKLVKEGKFQFAPMDEIAFYARISGMAVPFIFASKENLFSELVENVTSPVEEIINTEVHKSGNFKQKFFAMWGALYEHYSKHPDVIPFVEQMKSLSESSLSKIDSSKISDQLTDFFKAASDDLSNNVHPETLARVFHENVLNAAKSRTSTPASSENLRKELLPLLLWETCLYTKNNNEVYRECFS